MLTLTRQIYDLLSPDEQKKAVWVLLLTIITAFLEIIGIASILPFITVLSSPEMVENNDYLNWTYNFFEFQTINDFLIFLGFGVLFFLIIGNATKAYARWKILDFSVMAGHTISLRLFRQYLFQPYSFFLGQNASNLSKTVLGEVSTLVTNVLIPFADTVARVLTIVAILGLIMVADPFLALSAAVVLGGMFGLLYVSMRKWLQRIGQERNKAQGQRFKSVNEAFLGIKNLKLTGNEELYGDFFDRASRKFSKNTSMSSIAGEIPRFGMEIIAFGGILFIILYLLLQGQDFEQVMPMIAFYAFAGYRLMPGFQAIFKNYTKLRFYSGVLVQVQHDLNATRLDTNVSTNSEAIYFQNKIEFKSVGFSYENTERGILNDVNLTLNKNGSLGIVGKTGSGKTTLVDLLLGLLTPTEGVILIDGQPLTDENRRAWQKNCAYVTQHVYLTDDTIRANIAFGLPEDEIDDEQVRLAAKMASLDHFINNEVQNGYETRIGDNGIRLSGGQRQRLGLARALYLDRPVLVLDEATSALDTETENAVMEAINNLGGQKTIIMIAHRLKSLENVDNTLDLNKKINDLDDHF